MTFVYLSGSLILLLGLMRSWDWWDDRRRYLDPEARSERVLEWARTKGLEDPPAQINWESFEKEIAVRLESVGDPWADIREQELLEVKQKYADEDYRRHEKQTFEDEPSEHLTPPCPNCHGPTRLMYPIDLHQTYSTAKGRRVTMDVQIRCDACKWEGGSRDSYYNAERCDHEWERFTVDGGFRVKYVCVTCGVSLTNNPALISDDDLVKVTDLQTRMQAKFQPESAPVFAPFEIDY